jgi:hypothetical protein
MIYKCKKCGAKMDTDAAAKSLGYPPSAKVSFLSPSRCGVCGSTDIVEVSKKGK